MSALPVEKSDEPIMEQLQAQQCLLVSQCGEDDQHCQRGEDCGSAHKDQDSQNNQHDEHEKSDPHVLYEQIQKLDFDKRNPSGHDQVHPPTSPQPKPLDIRCEVKTLAQGGRCEVCHTIIISIQRLVLV